MVISPSVPSLTPITPETFVKRKRMRVDKKQAEEAIKKAQEAHAAGKNTGTSE